MLLLWTEADATNLRKYVGPVIADARIPHKIIPNLSCFPKVAASGDVVLACGTKALEFLIAAGVVPKNRTITSLREQVFWFNGIPVLVSFDCGLINRDYARLADVTWDILLAARYHNTGGLKAPLGEYRYVESLHEIIEEVEARFSKTGLPVDLACDLETKSLDPYNPEAWIIAASFSIDHGKSDVLYFEKGERPMPPPPFLSDDEMSYWEGLWCQIHWLLTTNKVSLRGANFKYDENWLVEKWGILPSNQKFDTVLVGTLLDENRSNSLKMHSKLMTEMGGYEDDMNKYDFSCLEVVPKPEMLNYIGGDSDATFRVAVKMKQELLKDRALSNFYVKLLQPSAKVFAKMERTGVLVDQPYYAELKAELESEIARLSTEMLAMLPAKLRYRHHEKIEKAMAEGKSPFIPALMKDFYFSPMGMNLKPQMLTAKTKEPSTSVDHLLMFGDVPEAAAFVEKFKELGSATKTYTTYVVGFLKHLRADGRFHSSYMLFKGEYGDDDESGTNTGRTSAKDPAIQCQRGSSLICCKTGNLTLKSVVEGFERGDSFLAKTHTGNWRPVIAAYRNGVRPVFEVTTRSGLITGCTENHPLLLLEGFVRTDATVVGDLVFVDKDWYASSAEKQLARGAVLPSSGGRQSLWASRKVGLPLRLRGNKRGFKSGVTRRSGEVMRVLAQGSSNNSWARGEETLRNLHLLGGDAEAGSWNHRGGFRFGSLRRRGLRPKVGIFRGFPSRYGSKTTGNFFGSKKQLERLLAGKLPLGHSVTAGQKQIEQRYDHIQWSDAMRSRMGRDFRSGDELVLPASPRLDRGRGFVDSKRAAEAGFVLDPIVSIRYIGDEETFDITVEEDHSFVSDGFVVHNTVPKHNKWAKKLRRAFIAPPGYVLLNCDFSQGELRIAAVLAEEPKMIEAYANGMDLHSITAAQLAGYEMGEFMLLPEDLRDELRSGGKAGNFGLLYGMQALGFKDYAFYSYGVKMTEEEAFLKRQAFFDLYSKLPEWHEAQKNFAKMHGYVRSPLGRVRHLPLIGSSDREARSKSERQSVNSPVQSCLSDMMQLAMVHIDRLYGHEDIHFCMMCHDAVTLYVPEVDAVEWAKRIKGVMETLPLVKDFNWNSPLKFVADAEIGVTFDALKKLKGI